MSGWLPNAPKFNLVDYLQHQREAIHKRISEMIEVAGTCGVNVVCMQEAWSMWQFYFIYLKISSF